MEPQTNRFWKNTFPSSSTSIPGNLVISMLANGVKLLTMARLGFPASTVARHCAAAIQVEIRRANWTSILAPFRQLHLNFWLVVDSALNMESVEKNDAMDKSVDSGSIDPSTLSNSVRKSLNQWTHGTILIPGQVDWMWLSISNKFLGYPLIIKHGNGTSSDVYNIYIYFCIYF